MEQYLSHTNYALWEVIVNGDAPAIASASAGTEGPIPPKTAEQKLARKNELKAKSTLLLAIPDEHLLESNHGIKDGKDLGEAIKAGYCSNKESKKIHENILKRNMRILLQSRLNGLYKTYYSLLGTLLLLDHEKRSDLDTLSMDDLYNNLKVYESEIKGQSSSNSQDVAFVSLENISSTNEAINTSHEVSSASSQGQASSSTYDDDVINEDGPKRNAPVDISTTNALVVQDRIGGYDWSFQGEEGITNFALMASSQGSSSSSSSNSEYDQQREALNKSNLEIIGYQIGLESLEARIVVHEKNEAVYEEDIAFLNAKDKAGLGYDSQMNKSEVVHSVFNSRESDVDNSPVNDRFKNRVKVKTARVNNVTTAGPKASAVVGYKENAVKSSACWIWRPTGNVIDHTSKDSGSYMFKRFDYGNPQYTLQDQGIFDSGCSRHMIGNKPFLTDYQEVDGGFVAFTGSLRGGVFKSWLVQDQTVPVQKQTAFGKDKSNPLIVDSLLKTIRLSIHLVVYNEELAIPEQTATGKGISNPLMAGSLPKTTKPT
ncbi:hypothetical protein Tco_1553692 [Tanacetum coccineum]